MMDRKRFPEPTIGNDLAAAGTVRHAIATDDSSHENSLDPPIRRSRYCERELEYVLETRRLDRFALEDFLDEKRKELKHFSLDPADLDVGELMMRGKADVVLRAGPNLVILDFKRGAYGVYEKKSNKLQFGVYARAVEQLLQESFEGRILISMNRIRESNRGAFKLPKSHLTMMPKGSDLEKMIDFNIVMNYLIRKQLLDDHDFYMRVRDIYMGKEITRDGKKTTKCRSLVGGSPCFSLQSRTCEIVYEYVRKGGDMRKLLIRGVSI